MNNSYAKMIESAVYSSQQGVNLFVAHLAKNGIALPDGAIERFTAQSSTSKKVEIVPVPVEDPVEVQVEDPVEVQVEDPVEVQVEDPVKVQVEDPVKVQVEVRMCSYNSPRKIPCTRPANDGSSFCKTHEERARRVVQNRRARLRREGKSRNEQDIFPDNGSAEDILSDNGFAED